MSRINTNVQSLIAQRALSQNNSSLSESLERLSTGLRITRGKDDPAGLIASENLRAELAATNAAISNAERADQVVNIAEGGLQEISTLMTELQGLLTSSANGAGLSKAEKEANQLQIDSILQTVDRVAGATSFQGLKLLNGNFDYQTQNVASTVETFSIRGAKFNSASQAVNINVTASAQQAGLFLSLGATTINLNGATGSSFTVEIAGTTGAREFSFASGTTLANIAANVNTFTEVTGVTATASGNGIVLRSSEFGSTEFTSVRVITDAGLQGTSTTLGVYKFLGTDASALNTTVDSSFTATGATNGVRDDGQNIAGTVNGIQATSEGRQLSINTDFLDVEVTLNTATSQTLGVVNAFDITGGGADFQLAPRVDITGKVSLGIEDVATRKLGERVNGTVKTFLDDLGSGKSLNVVNGDVTEAQKVVDAAINEISSLRGRLGAFQKNVIGTTVRSLQIAVENTAAAESQIRDADFAAETAALTRNQILVSAAGQTLALANQQPQQVLQLLG